MYVCLQDGCMMPGTDLGMLRGLGKLGFKNISCEKGHSSELLLVSSGMNSENWWVFFFLCYNFLLLSDSEVLKKQTKKPTHLYLLKIKINQQNSNNNNKKD